MNPHIPVALTELIRRSIASRHELTVFERIRLLNAELTRLGVQSRQDDHLVRKVIGKRRSR
jgi:hypothetical protein